MYGRKVKIITMLLGVSLMLNGCGNAVTEAPTTSEVTEGDGQQAEVDGGVVKLRVCGAEEDAQLLAQITESFKAQYPEATFDISIEAVSESNCRDALLDDVLNAPDVYTFADDQLSAFAASGLAKPIAYNLDDVKNRNSSSSVDAASVNGQIFAYPLTADNGYFLYYNKKYFAPDTLASMDSILSVCAANGKKMTMDFTSGWYLYSFFGNTGLEVGLNDDGISNFCTWNESDGEISGVDICYALLDITANPGFMNGGDSALVAGAQDDSVIAGVSGVWLSNDLTDAWGSDLGAIKLPTYTVGDKQVQMSSYAGYKMVGVNSYSNNVEWAEKLADWMTNEQNQTLRFEMRGQGPSNTVAASSGSVSDSPAIQALIQQSDYSSLQRIGSNYWGPVGELGEALVNANFDGLSLQDFLDNIVADITAS